MRIRTIVLKAFPTQKRIESLQTCIEEFLGQESPPVFLWLRLLGYLNSLIALVPLGRRRVRALQHVLHRNWQGENQEVRVPWDSDIRENLQWWAMDCNLFQGVSLRTKFPDLMLSCDAPDQGWGAVVGRSFVSGRWTMEEQQMSINWLELKAIQFNLQHFHQQCGSIVVAVFSDNSVAYLTEGRQDQFSL